MKRQQTTELFLEYVFTREELEQFGKDLARDTAKQSELDGNKKMAMSQFKAEIDACAAKANVTADHIRSGREMRMVECEIRYDKPGRGRKSVVRTDTREIVKVMDMEPFEKQGELPLVEEPPPPPEEAAPAEAETEDEEIPA